MERSSRPRRTSRDVVAIALIAIAAFAITAVSAPTAEANFTCNVNLRTFEYNYAVFTGVAGIGSSSCGGTSAVLLECQTTVKGPGGVSYGPNNASVNFCDSEADYQPAIPGTTLDAEYVVYETVSGPDSFEWASPGCQITSPKTARCFLFVQHKVGFSPIAAQASLKGG